METCSARSPSSDSFPRRSNKYTVLQPSTPPSLPDPAERPPGSLAPVAAILGRKPHGPPSGALRGDADSARALGSSRPSSGPRPDAQHLLGCGLEATREPIQTLSCRGATRHFRDPRRQGRAARASKSAGCARRHPRVPGSVTREQAATAANAQEEESGGPDRRERRAAGGAGLRACPPRPRPRASRGPRGLVTAGRPLPAPRGPSREGGSQARRPRGYVGSGSGVLVPSHHAARSPGRD